MSKRVTENKQNASKSIPVFGNGIRSRLGERNPVPFFGNVDIAIFPSGKIIGVSKFAQLIDFSCDISRQMVYKRY